MHCLSEMSYIYIVIKTNAMTTFTHKNREFSIIEKTPITHYPALAASQTNIDFCFIAKGKRGSLVSGYITKSKSVIVF